MPCRANSAFFSRRVELFARHRLRLRAPPQCSLYCTLTHTDSHAQAHTEKHAPRKPAQTQRHTGRHRSLIARSGKRSAADLYCCNRTDCAALNDTALWGYTYGSTAAQPVALRCRSNAYTQTETVKRCCASHTWPPCVRMPLCEGYTVALDTAASLSTAALCRANSHCESLTVRGASSQYES